MSFDRSLPLHWRLSLAFGLLVSLLVGAVLLLWISSNEGYEREFRQQLNHDVARHLAEHAVPLTPEGVDESELHAMFMHVMSVNPALEVYLLDAGGKILAYDAPPGHVKLERVALAPVRQLLAGSDQLVLGQDPRAPGVRQPISAWPVEQGAELLGYIYVVVGGEDWRATAAPLQGARRRRIYVLTALGLILFGIAVTVLLARRLTRPLRRLRDAMDEGRAAPAALLRAGDELGQLARTYKEMSGRIAEQFEELERVDRNRREFVASVSHDLRTPLASLQGYLELLEDSVEPGEEERRTTLALTRGRARHLSRLVDQLFDLAKLDAGDVILEEEAFNLAELTQDVLQGLKARAARRGLRLCCRMPRELPEVVGDLRLIERVLSNLIENAVKYTRRGGEVEVRLRSLPGAVAWSVHDDGPGIPDEEQSHVFERRYRGSGRRKASGTGLGLSLCQRVLELHGSRIEVESNRGEGCTFRFELEALRPRTGVRRKDSIHS